ncbi:hypothetical protein BLA29_014512 [Euroglyphus maynei]|uniref:Uncharacterized protein n=1 Tax=Euroglyphus maynei TaxID=6958 RepID=A0A1Y3BFT5_EURMA|nr:hypothetical protein BLA29_014512 [Euroglyphus maynei]
MTDNKKPTIEWITIDSSDDESDKSSSDNSDASSSATIISQTDCKFFSDKNFFIEKKIKIVFL